MKPRHSSDEKRPQFLIVDLRSVLMTLPSYPHLMQVLPKLPVHDLVGGLLAVSANRIPSPALQKDPGLWDAIRHDNDAVWYMLEKNLGEQFELLNLTEVDVELLQLQEQLDGHIGQFLPQHWGVGEYTSWEWLGDTSLMVLRDGTHTPTEICPG